MQTRNLQASEAKQCLNLLIPGWENYLSSLCLSAKSLGHLSLVPDACRTVRKKVAPEGVPAPEPDSWEAFT